MHLRWLALITFGLALPALAGGGTPPPPPAGGGRTDETPPGYQVRLIGAGNQQIKLSGASRLHLKGDGSLRRGNGGNTNGLLLVSCRQILVTDLTFSNWYCGVRMNDSTDLEFRRVVCTANAQQGFLGSNVSRATLRHCEGSKTRGQHGVYFGNWSNGRTAEILIEDSSFFGSSLAEAQWNAESASKAAVNITLRRVKVTNDKFATNFLGAQQVTLEGCQIKSSRKAVSCDRPYGRPWPSLVTATGGTTIIGTTYIGTGSKLTRQ